jgi:DNA polymerase III psi subunit
MDLTPSQLSSLNEMGIPVWALRTANPENDTSETNQQALLTDCLVLIETHSDDQQVYRLLTAMLFSIGLHSEQFTIINSKQLSQLQSSITQQKLLLVLGEEFAQSLWGSSIVRGKSHQTLDADILTVVSYSLEELLASPDNKASVWQDLLLAKQILDAS